MSFVPVDDDKPAAAPSRDIYSVQVYKAACRKFGQVPSKLVCRHMGTCDLQLKNSHLDASGAKAIAVALVVSSVVLNG